MARTPHEIIEILHGSPMLRSDVAATWECQCCEFKATDQWVAALLDVRCKNMSGKGDRYRPVDKDEFDRSFVAIFGDKPKHRCREWIRTKDGGLVCYHCGELPPPTDLEPLEKNYKP